MKNINWNALGAIGVIRKSVYFFILLSLLSPFKIKNIYWNALGAIGLITKGLVLSFYFITPNLAHTDSNIILGMHCAQLAN